jgi:hypothetical protein
VERVLNHPGGAVHLVVGNQSFEVDPVDIDVTVDGEVVAEGSFSVGGDQPPQHNWKRYEVDLAPGPHVVVASSPHDGARAELTIDVPAVQTVTVAYWRPGFVTVEADDNPPAMM